MNTTPVLVAGTHDATLAEDIIFAAAAVNYALNFFGLARYKSYQ